MKLQIFARWGSNVILRYVADSPLANISLHKPATSGASSSSALPQVPFSSQQVERRLAAMEDTIQQAVKEAADLKEEVRRLHGDVRPGFVQNPASGAWRKVLSASVGVPPNTWKTYCGWKFGGAGHTLSSHLPTSLARACVKCFPERGIHIAASSGSDEGTGSSGSGLS